MAIDYTYRSVYIWMVILMRLLRRVPRGVGSLPGLYRP